MFKGKFVNLTHKIFLLEKLFFLLWTKISCFWIRRRMWKSDWNFRVQLVHFQNCCQCEFLHDQEHWMFHHCHGFGFFFNLCVWFTYFTFVFSLLSRWLNENGPWCRLFGLNFANTSTSNPKECCMEAVGFSMGNLSFLVLAI